MNRQEIADMFMSISNTETKLRITTTTTTPQYAIIVTDWRGNYDKNDFAVVITKANKLFLQEEDILDTFAVNHGKVLE